MTTRLRSLLRVGWETFKGWKGDRCDTMGAALAFFALLAVPSFVVLSFMLVDAIWGRVVLETHVIPFASKWLNPRLVALARYLVPEVTEFHPNRTAVTVSGIILLALGVGGFAGQLRASIRRIWGKYIAELSPKEFVSEKAMAALLPLILGAMVAVGIHTRIFLRGLLKISLGAKLTLDLDLLELVGTILYWGACIALLYKLLIPVHIRWRAILPGAFATSSLIGVGRYFAIRHLLSKELVSLSGLVGDVFLVLLLFYFYAELFLVGAELTRVLALRWETTHPASHL